MHCLDRQMDDAGIDSSTSKSPKLPQWNFRIQFEFPASPWQYLFSYDYLNGLASWLAIAILSFDSATCHVVSESFCLFLSLDGTGALVSVALVSVAN